MFERAVKSATRWLLAVLASRGNKSRRIPPDFNPKKIIIIRQHNQFGDVLCTVPLFRALSRKYNPQVLAVVVSPENSIALDGCEYVTELIKYDKLSFYRKPGAFFSFVKRLRQNYDLLLVPSNVSISLTNDIMAYFVKAKMKIGPRALESRSNRTSSVYDIAVDLTWGDTIKHQSFRNMEVAVPLGIDPAAESGELEYHVGPGSSEEVERILSWPGDRAVKKIAMHVGAGKPPNQWSTDGFARLAELLHSEYDAQLILTEGHMDHELVDYMTTLLKIPFVRIRDMAVPFVAAILKRMDLVITNDTGIMHLAAASGAPTLSLFGPTDPLQWAPLGKNHRFILGINSNVRTIPVEKVMHLARKMLS